ncbi:PREDICTED: fibronectin type III domain-containing protein 5-like, partial [Pterocles gutturalis]|uniref:fibronectin type III domain-containing protein 5-like n=2 Tax=Columbimorphae TaxID=3073799 RepID=UPI0005291827
WVSILAPSPAALPAVGGKESKAKVRAGLRMLFPNLRLARISGELSSPLAWQDRNRERGMGWARTTEQRSVCQLSGDGKPTRAGPFPSHRGHGDSWPAEGWCKRFIDFCIPHSPSAPVNVTVKHLKANSAVVTWDVLEDEVVIGFAISQQKKDVRMLRFIQEVNTTTRSCALWDLEEDTEYIVHVQSISIQGQSPASEPVLFKTPREAEKLASKNKDEVTMKEMEKKNQQLRAGEILIIVVVLFMWAGVIALFCRQYDIIKDNEPNNSKEKVKSASENSTPEHQSGGLLRSKFPKNKPSVNIIEA